MFEAERPVRGVVVTFGVGAVFGVVAAIAVVVVAGDRWFAFEIGDMQFCSGPPLGTKVWVSDADSGSSRSGTSPRFPERVGPAGAS